MVEQFIKDIRPFFCERAIVYFDVGAFEGSIFTEIAESDLGTVLEAHLIEPNPASFEQLQKTVLAAKRHKRTRCHNLALGAAAGTMKLRAAGDRTRVVASEGSGSIAESSGVFEVEVAALDDVTKALEIDHISILKIDVEGFEGEVLKGASRLLDAQAIDIIYIEAGLDPANSQQYYYRFIEDTLSAKGYRLFRIYEQKHEWMTDSPFLRRVNLAFMSQAFAAQNPFRLSRKFFELQRRTKEYDTKLIASAELEAALRGEQAALQAKHEALVEKNVATLKEVSDLSKEIQDAAEEHAKQIAFLRHEASGKDVLLANIEVERATLEKRICELEQSHQQEIQRLRSEFDKTVQNHGREMLLLQAELDKIKQRLDESLMVRSSLEGTIQGQERSYGQQILTLQSELADWQRRFADGEIAKASLEKVIRECGQEISAKQNEIAEKELQLQLLDGKYEADTAELKRELIERERLQAEVCAKLADATKKSVEADKSRGLEISSLKTVVAAREKLLASKTTELSLIKAKTSQLAEEVKRQRTAADAYQQRIAEQERQIERQISEMQASRAAFETQIHTVKEMVSFRLGATILDAFKSPANVLSLPQTLWNLHRETAARLSVGELRKEIENRGASFQRMLKVLSGSGMSDLRKYFNELNLSSTSRALALGALAKELYPSSPAAAIEAAKEAQNLDPKPFRAKWLAFRLFEQGKREDAADLLAGPAAGCEFSPSERRKMEQITGRQKKAGVPRGEGLAAPAVRDGEKAGQKKPTPGIKIEYKNSLPSQELRISKDAPTPKVVPSKREVIKVKSKAAPRKSQEGEIAASEFGKKLWSGYANYAIEALEKIKSDAAAPAKERESAAWHLASWFFVQKDFLRALENIEPLSVSSEKPSQKYLLIEARCLLSLERYSDCLALLDRAIQTTGKPDFQLLKADLVRRMALQRGEAVEQVDGAQLAELNKLYSGVGLAPIAKKDDGLPLSFANIHATAETEVERQDYKVSVIMPAFNAQDTIEVAIESLLSQTWANLEIIVVDDCSTDSTAEIVSKLSARDARVRLLRSTENCGAYPSRNKALEVISGDLIMVHDSDDWSHPQKVEIQVRELMAMPDCVAVMSHWVRLDENFGVIAGWQPKETLFDVNLSSLLFRKTTMEEIGKWDDVRVSGDSEFYSRLKTTYGTEAISKISSKYLLSLSLVRKESLTNQKATHVSSLLYGVRWQYKDAYVYSHAKRSKAMAKSAALAEFPVPMGNKPNRQLVAKFDIVVVSDFAMRGGAFVSTLNYVIAACKAGKKVGVVHWRKYNLSSAASLQSRLYDACLELGFDILTVGDSVETELVIVGYPAILQHRIDPFPQISTKKLVVVVNQFAARLVDGGDPQYDPTVARANLRSLFGQEGLWIPISPWVSRLMQKDGRYAATHPHPWFPMIDATTWCDVPLRWRGGERVNPVVGRHGRDTYTKWPSSEKALRDAYGVNAAWEMRILGGADQAIARLGGQPANWTVIPFDGMGTKEFLGELDFYIHYPHESYIEEFGRGIMEAMALGVPVVVPRQFSETFGEAVLYAEPEDVDKVLRELWSSEDRYLERAKIGRKFVVDHCDIKTFPSRLCALE